MMYLSKLVLNPRNRRVQREVAQRYELHRTIMRAFPDDLPKDERVLFRLEVDARTGSVLLLVQSVHEPDWSWLDAPDLHQYLLKTEDPNPWVKAFHLSFVEGQVLRFRLRANPTVKRKVDGKSKRLGLYREEEQLEWLKRKAQQHGFHVLGVRLSQEQVIQSRLYRNDTKHNLQLLGVQFDGALQVIQPDRLLDGVKQGIGSGKGLGFGLLSLAPA